MTTAPPALPGRTWNKRLKESRELACLLLGMADMRVVALDFGPSMASTQLRQIRAVPALVSRSGNSEKIAAPAITPITKRTSVNGPSKDASAYFSATIPAYMPSGPKKRNRASQGRVATAGVGMKKHNGILPIKVRRFVFAMVVSALSVRL